MTKRLCSNEDKTLLMFGSATDICSGYSLIVW